MVQSILDLYRQDLESHWLDKIFLGLDLTRVSICLDLTYIYVSHPKSARTCNIQYDGLKHVKYLSK